MNVSPAELDELPAAARNHLAAPASGSGRVLVPATLPRTAAAVAIDLFVAVVPGGVATLVVTMVGWGLLLDTDFDGPDRAEALGEWLLLATWGALFLAYTSVEAFGRRTAGKAALRLRLVREGDHGRASGWRFRLRWALAYLPLIAMTLTCAAGALRAGVMGIDGFEEYGWVPDRRLLVLGGVLLLYALAGVLLPWGPEGRALWDWVSGVELKGEMTPGAHGRQRGFEVVPPPA